jgi:hypothetical protein
MTNGDKVLLFLCKNRQAYCDDCLSDLITVTPRQQVNQICNDKIGQYINTQTAICHHCGKNKLVRSL